jgi:hypothetical protein
MEAERDRIDEDEFLTSVHIELRLVGRYDDPIRGLDVGDVRTVVVTPSKLRRNPGGGKGTSRVD